MTQVGSCLCQSSSNVYYVPEFEQLFDALKVTQFIKKTIVNFKDEIENVINPPTHRFLPIPSMFFFWRKNVLQLSIKSP